MRKQHTLAPGAGILAERMIAKSGAELRLASPVIAIDQSADEAVVTIADGRKVHGARRDRLPADQCAQCDRLHAGALDAEECGDCARPWRQGDQGVDQGARRSGRPSCDRRRRRIVLDVCRAHGARTGRRSSSPSASPADGFDPDDRHAVAGALQRFFPEAELVAWDWHDWVADPWSRGTWVALPADALGDRRSRQLAAGGQARLRDLRHFARPGRLVRRARSSPGRRQPRPCSGNRMRFELSSLLLSSAL